METYHSFLGNAAALADRKLRVAIGSGVESYVPKTRVVRHEAKMQTDGGAIELQCKIGDLLHFGD